MSHNSFPLGGAEQAGGGQEGSKNEEAESPQCPRQVNTCVVLQTQMEELKESALPPGNRRRVDGKGFALALDRNFFWKVGCEIKVRFLDGDPKTHEKVIQIARQWEKVANIHFVFVFNNDDANAAVRITFSEHAGGGWSALGNDCLRHPQNEATMGIGLTWESQNFESTVLHEFGHVLGCVHEHSSPASTIKFKEENIYKHYWNQWQWSPEKVNKEILHRYHAEHGIHHTEFDCKSIMIYPFDPYVLETPNQRIDRPTCLSECDKKFIRQCYPYPKIPEKKGVFFSWNYQRWGLEVPTNTARVTFPSKLSTKPRIGVGLAQFDLDHGTDLRIMTFTQDITEEDFHIRTTTWATSVMYSAGSMWFRTDRASSGTLQTGVFDTDFDSKYDLKNNVKEVINFDPKFTSTPEVVVFLKGFHLGCKSEWKLSVTTGSVNESGFELLVLRGEKTKLHRAIVTWFAYSSDDHSIFSGTVDSNGRNFREEPSEGAGHDPRMTHSRRLSPPKKLQGASKFRVYAGVNAFHFCHENNLRLHVESKIPEDEDNTFCVKLKTWNKSKCHSAGASYLGVYE